MDNASKDIDDYTVRLLKKLSCCDLSYRVSVGNGAQPLGNPKDKDFWKLCP